MFLHTTLLVSALACLVSADYTWPNPILDELEDITQVQSGLFRSGFLDGVTPCNSFSGRRNPTRQASSEWLRTAFHDAITHDIASGTGGVDASLIWETDRAENLGGRSFNSTFNFMLGYYNVRASMSDLIALGTYTAVRNCGGPPLVMRAGRVDAKEPGPEGGVPEPKDSLKTMLAKFGNAGFNQTDMIQMVACGHTLGGVHGEFFPELTGNASPTNFPTFDTTTDRFDNRVVTEYLNGTSTNPLVTAPGGNNSDFTVFNADGNSTVQAMSAPATFLSTCGSILQRMIDTVPSTVKLSDPLTPMRVKPRSLQLQLSSTGQVILTGYIRVMDDRQGEPVVKLIYADRDGKISQDRVSTILVRAQGGTGIGFEASFRFFDIGSAKLPNGISSFNVSVTSSAGTETIYDNNGHGYPLKDTIIFQQPQSCLISPTDVNANMNLTVTAAVWDGLSLTNPSMDVAVKSERPNSVVPLITVESVPMKHWRDTAFGYALYSISYSLPLDSWDTSADVWVQGPDGTRHGDDFKQTGSLSGECGPF